MLDLPLGADDTNGSNGPKPAAWVARMNVCFGIVAVFGKINPITTKPDKQTGEFTLALRAKVREDKIVLWHWFEFSFAVSQAYHGQDTISGRCQRFGARPM
ncbi:hypothetical protein [Hoeflea sp. AS16]|uniref:hypothetical protein n=1 Tax=Hoeflea sp. AS16 TaxID=3135779 RepID=UPI00317F00B9